ncbi:MAG: DUF190 domain-containing protein [Eudoraea sp.]|nr:DUF190 domain-containing protein [Eudoraea sp.]
MSPTEYSAMKIYASSTDKVGMRLLHEHIVHKARDKGLTGATVYRGMMGFGMSSKTISSSKFWELTEKLPVTIEIIDKTEVLEEFYESLLEDLERMNKGCLITMEPVYVKLLKPGSKQ